VGQDAAGKPVAVDVFVYAFVTGALFWLPIAPPWWLLLGSHPAWVWLGVGIVTVFGTRESARPT
jgi:hypothetical protein